MNDSLEWEKWELERHALENRFIDVSFAITAEFREFGYPTCDMVELLRRINHAEKTLARIRCFCAKGDFKYSSSGNSQP